MALGPAALGSVLSETSSGSPADALAALEGRPSSTAHSSSSGTPLEHLQSDEEDADPLPPVTGSTWKGRLPPDVPKPVEADLSRLWVGMIESLDDTCQVWDLFSQIKSTPLPKSRNPSMMVDADEAAPGQPTGLPAGVSRNPLLLDADPVESAAKRLSGASIGSQGVGSSNSPVDFLEMINGTTKTIRAVRNYLFALPPLPRLARSVAPVASSTFADIGPSAGQVASPTATSTPTSTLRKKPSIQFNNEEHLPGVKPRDAFKRQSSFQSLPKSSDRRRSFIGSSGFAAEVADGESKGTAKSGGSTVKTARGGDRGNGRQPHAPSSFVPFETVQQRRRSSVAFEDGDDERAALRRELGLDQNDAASPPTLGRGLPSSAVTPVGAVAASERDARSQSPQRTVTTPAAIGPSAPPQDDPLVVVRSSALEVLGMLRSLEESNRFEKSDRIEEEADNVGLQLPPGYRRRHLPSTVSVRMMRDYSEGGHEDSGTSSTTRMRAPKEDADEEVEGYLYRQDVTLSSLEKQREVVSKYLATVDSVLASVSKVSELRKYMRAGEVRQTASGLVGGDGGSGTGNQTTMDSSSGLVATDDERLPTWARRTFSGDDVERARTLLLDVLPDLPADIFSSDMTQMLTALSDGQILCHAYNAALRRSGRPWGFIQSSAVHDVKGEEESSRGSRLSSDDNTRRPPGWTFRRIENLKRFSAAVALRYGVKTGRQTGVEFDAGRVAKMDNGWDVMLRQLVLRWVNMVVEEERGS